MVAGEEVNSEGAKREKRKDVSPPHRAPPKSQPTTSTRPHPTTRRRYRSRQPPGTHRNPTHSTAPPEPPSPRPHLHPTSRPHTVIAQDQPGMHGIPQKRYSMQPRPTRSPLHRSYSTTLPATVRYPPPRHATFSALAYLVR